MSNKFVKTLKKIPGFLADVAKEGFRYLKRKLGLWWEKKLDGRKPAQAFKDGAVSLAKRFMALSFRRKALIISFLILFACFCSVHNFCTTHFMPGTVICGTDVSEMSLKEARSALSDACSRYELTLFEKDGEAEKITGSQIGLEVTITDGFDDILKLRSGYSWITSVMKNESVSPGDTVLYSYDEALLEKTIAELDCVNASSAKKPVNAELYFADGEFKIREAISGDNVDKQRLAQRVKTAVENQEKAVDLQVENLYEMPDVLSDDPALAAKKEICDGLLDTNISLKIGSSMETIGPETLADWYNVNSDGSSALDESKIKAYVETLAAKYNTVNSPKLFVTHGGDTIEVGNSYYGWQLDSDYAVQMLSSFASGKSSVTADLTNRSEESDKWWLKTGVEYDDMRYYGNTYAEVSIDSQYMWMYQNGEVAFESEVVTGLPDSEHDTPVGIYSILYKERNATLRGDDYETEVAYWMVFTDDIGFHDADWQDAFGDDMYEYNGSHGCVNLPVEAAGELYELVYPGMPVFVY